jgi:hypothetical protein
LCRAIPEARSFMAPSIYVSEGFEAVGRRTKG